MKSTYDEMLGLYGQEALDIASYRGPEMRIVACPSCGGDGGWEKSPRQGQMSGDWQECRCCDGVGEYEIEAETATLEDLEAIADEEAQS